MAVLDSVVGRLLYVVGIVLMMHAAYSAVDHLAYLKAVGRHETSLPSDIVLETLLSLAFFIPGAVLVSGTLKPIALELELATKTMDSIDATPGFKVLNTRASAIFGTAQ
ncbi:magnesium transporter [Entophlyctis helioformis]|nr:magnesium transporter [Entophlyctis helioformis]